MNAVVDNYNGPVEINQGKFYTFIIAIVFIAIGYILSTVSVIIAFTQGPQQHFIIIVEAITILLIKYSLTAFLVFALLAYKKQFNSALVKNFNASIYPYVISTALFIEALICILSFVGIYVISEGMAYTIMAFGFVNFLITGTAYGFIKRMFVRNLALEISISLLLAISWGYLIMGITLLKNILQIEVDLVVFYDVLLGISAIIVISLAFIFKDITFGIVIIINQLFEFLKGMILSEFTYQFYKQDAVLIPFIIVVCLEFIVIVFISFYFRKQAFNSEASAKINDNTDGYHSIV